MATVRSPDHWKNWCEALWRQNEGAWMNRDGQDHAYRHHVVVPALVKALRKRTETTLVDLGCGDGAMTDMLLHALKEDAPATTVLVDRSKPQLETAHARLEKHRTRAIILKGELNAESSSLTAEAFFKGIRDVSSGHFSWVSVFAMQELPSLGQFFHGVGSLMKPGERLYGIVVAHTFAEKLKRTKRAFVEGIGADGDDFVTAMRYPIGTGNKGEVFYLPHFQRRVVDYRVIGRRHGLRLTEVQELTVPRTADTEQIFLPSIYGEDILNHISSQLLTFEKVR